jgi:copper chaperone
MSERRHVELQVSGMTCQGCVNAVTRIVQKKDPAANVKVDLASGRLEAETAAAVEELARAISAGGYEARIA